MRCQTKDRKISSDTITIENWKSVTEIYDTTSVSWMDLICGVELSDYKTKAMTLTNNSAHLTPSVRFFVRHN